MFALSKLFPVMTSARSEPMAASGIEKSMTSGVVNDSNTMARIMKISRNAARIRNLKSSN